ncbi:LytTR family DNA-binding domain-containing protein [Actibacterium sp. XHP0104]|uniref:LytTR family DNA-binding domain-containing protein n=1 Tax=Actibacterium sp. XHP0104 TaxID=2984335 RepID=UPI0021E7AD05|nr:LytTR family DNA-binding domain-containing protein [Actibacterium sp. XHP0104]MCV2880506.1 LytTR family transcriptional regulator [Actibacterium sp. XHP0104]
MTELKEALWAAFFSRKPWLIWAVLSVIVTFLGPFGTYTDMPLVPRFIYWFVVVGVSVVIGMTVRITLSHLMKGFPYWQLTLVTAAAVSVILSGPLYWFSQFYLSMNRSAAPVLQELMFIVFNVSVMVGTVRWLLREAPWRASSATTPEIRSVRLIERLEPEMQGPILRCSAVGHLVEVQTDKGVSKLRMRFSDALAELDGIAGMQVHRSHWVSRHAVSGHLLEKGRVFLKLQDGSLIPVSRNFRDNVAENGLLGGSE